MGDIGERRKHITLEPVENPVEIPPEPVKQPEPEKVGA